MAAAGVTLLAVVWSAWLVATPVVAAHGSTRSTLVAAAATYRIGRAICHQQPDRSFHFSGVQTPVCARCLGLYLGAAIGALAGLGWPRRRSVRSDRARMPVTAVRTLLLAAAVPTAVLWALEHGGGVGVSNFGRFAGAVPLGAAVAWFVVAWAAGAWFDGASARAIH